MKHYKILLIIFLLTTYKGVSQGQKKDSTKINYITFSIGKATDNTFTKSKPAQFISTFPNQNEIDDSYLIDGYFDVSYTTERAIDEVFSSITSYGVFYEMHKNTLVGVANEQDVRQFGMTFNHTWGAIREFDDPFSITGKRKESLRDYVLSGSIRRSNNILKKENSLQVILGFKINRLRSRKSADKDYFTFLNATQKLPKKGNFSKVLQISYDYNIGLGYINNKNEDVLLGNFDFQFNAYPLSKLLQNEFKQEQLLFISYIYSARGELLGNLISDGRPFRTLTYGLEFKLGKSSKIQLAYNNIRGANPYKGLVYQNYNTMDFKVKFSIDTKE